VDDAAIKTQIKAKLQTHAAAGLGNVDVESNGGVVRLTGLVQRPELKQRAAELARNVDGVRDIVNHIEVRAA
jgi:hyperosmotically inducible protein